MEPGQLPIGADQEYFRLTQDCLQKVILGFPAPDVLLEIHDRRRNRSSNFLLDLLQCAMLSGQPVSVAPTLAAPGSHHRKQMQRIPRDRGWQGYRVPVAIGFGLVNGCDLKRERFVRPRVRGKPLRCCARPDQ